MLLWLGEDAVDAVRRAFRYALELERGSPAGVANLFADGIIFFMGTLILAHVLFFEIVDVVARGLLGVINLFCEIWFKYNGWQWRVLEWHRPAPAGTKPLKLVAGLCVLILLCPVLLAATRAA